MNNAPDVIIGGGGGGISGGGGTSVTGTGLWHSIGGVLQGAAFLGAAATFPVVNAGGTDVAYVAMSGAATMTAAGVVTVNLAAGATITGTLPVANLPNLAGDVTGAVNANTLVQMTGSAGVVTILANVSLTGTAGTGALNLGSMTGATALPTGNLSWTGAATKTAVLTSSGASLTVNTVAVIATSGATTTLSLGLSSTDVVLFGATTSQKVQCTLSPTGLACSTQSDAAQNPNNFTVTPQAPNAGAAATGPGTPGSFIVNAAAPVSTGAEGSIIFQRAGTPLASIQAQVGTAANGAIYLGSNVTAPSATNFSIRCTGGATSISGPSQVDFMLAGVSSLTAVAGTLQLRQPLIAWTSGQISPSLVQSAQASTSIANGINGQDQVHQAQAGQNATGAAHNGGNGGQLTIAGGIAGTSGSATQGFGGRVIIGSALALQCITINNTNTPYAVDTLSTTSDLVIAVDTTSATPVTVTLPQPRAGRTIVIKDTTGHANAHNITINRNSGESIDGAASYVLNLNFACVWLCATDAVNWAVIAEYNGTVI